MLSVRLPLKKVEMKLMHKEILQQGQDLIQKIFLRLQIFLNSDLAAKKSQQKQNLLMQIKNAVSRVESQTNWSNTMTEQEEFEFRLRLESEGGATPTNQTTPDEEIPAPLRLMGDEPSLLDGGPRAEDASVLTVCQLDCDEWRCRALRCYTVEDASAPE